MAAVSFSACNKSVPKIVNDNLSKTIIFWPYLRLTFPWNDPLQEIVSKFHLIDYRATIYKIMYLIRVALQLTLHRGKHQTRHNKWAESGLYHLWSASYFLSVHFRDEILFLSPCLSTFIELWHCFHWYHNLISSLQLMFVKSIWGVPLSIIPLNIDILVYYHFSPFLL